MWGQKAPPKLQSGDRKCRQNAKVGGKKRHQNSKVTAKSATTQIRGKKSWWRNVPSKCKSGGGKCHQTSKMMVKKCHYISTGIRGQKSGIALEECFGIYPEPG